MKEKENGVSNPPVSKVSPEEGKGRDMAVVILNIFLAIVTVALLGYIAYRNGYINLDNILNVQEEVKDQEEEIQDEQSTDFVEQEDPLVLETYEGEYLSAIVPLEWSIVEHTDGEGTEMIAGTISTGLTGIQILHRGVEIMKLEGVSGIGFVGCRELPRFLDSSPEYEQMQKELNEEIQAEEIEYLDYTDTPYSEFEWLGKRFRRIGAALYYDTIEGDVYFQPQCEVSFFRIEAFGFEDEDGYVGDTYMYTISQTATAEELETLDDILVSMVAN
jgi:hypothetical protein